MSLVKVSGNASGTGTLTIAAPNTNSDFTLTLPAATTTFVGTDATQTLTNKTLTSPTINSGTLASSTLTTPNIDSAQIPTVSGTAPLYMCRAWVNFDGTSAANLSGTYAITSPSTTLTVTATAHGLIVGSSVNLDFTTGTGLDGIYTVVTVADANTFTVTTVASTTTSGNVTLLRNTIRASGNVSSITDNGTGDYTVNFTTAMTDANYSVCGITGDTIANNVFIAGATAAPTTLAYRFNARTTANSNTDMPYLNVAIFR